MRSNPWRLVSRGENHQPEITRNKLLESIPAEERSLVWFNASEVEIPAGALILEPEEPFTHVYFPETAVFSQITELKQGNSVESGTIGFEGFVGLPILFGGESSPHRTIVQIPGRACVLRAADFAALLPTVPELHRLMQRYVLAFIAQIAQTAACNSQHDILQRCARWILLTHDRVGSAEILLTQEFFAYMLGVRRPSVTAAQAELKRRELIDYTRGKLHVLDLGGLEALACECHDVVRSEFSKLVGSQVG